jgi:RimJ/RimL family protein N-acetyltransferase
MPDIDTEFKKRTIRIFREMKFEYEKRPDDLMIPVYRHGNVIARLRPIHHRFNLHEIELLKKWRNRNREAFLTWTTSTERSTRRWITQQILPREDRILLLAETLDGVAFGQVGLTNFDFARKACELDNWIRGKGGWIKGGMMLAIQSLMDWVFFTLKADITYARVFSENVGVINRHMQNGLRIVKCTALRRVDDTEGCRWVEIEKEGSEAAQKYLVYLELIRGGYRRLNHPAEAINIQSAST